MTYFARWRLQVAASALTYLLAPVASVALPSLAALVGSSAAVLVTPVWDEPYGLVVAEAIACGTPVVAFARGGIPEVMPTSGLGALVQPHDVAALAAAIPGVLELDRAAVRDHAVRHLSRARMVSRYERIYGQLRQDATHEDSLPA